MAFVDWARTVVSGIVGAAIGASAVLYTQGNNLRLSREIAEINLERELSRDYYETNPVFKNIRISIESCAKLYRSWGGKFGHDDLNNYLAFFDDVGFFWASGTLKLETIDHFFGPDMIETYEYGEVRQYISQTSQNAKQPGAFENFLELVPRLELLPDNRELVVAAKGRCVPKAAGASG